MEADDNMNGVKQRHGDQYTIHTCTTFRLQIRPVCHSYTTALRNTTNFSKEHKQLEDLAGIQAQHHEQQLRKELSMVAQDNDAKHGDANSRQEAYQEDRPQYYVFDRGSTWEQKVYQFGKCMDDLLQLIRLCPLRDAEHSMSMKGYTSEQNMTTIEDGYNTADDGGPLQIRESSGYEEQHIRSFHKTS